MVDPRELITVGEAAKRVGVSVQTVRRWCNQGHLTVRRTPGNQRRLVAAEVDALITPEPEPTEAAS